MEEAGHSRPLNNKAKDAFPATDLLRRMRTWVVETRKAPTHF
jgi:hypothetical protein